MARQPKPSDQGNQLVAVSAEFSGPIPHPGMLQKYDELVPGAAERILRMAEKQQEHRQALEARVVNGNTAAQTRGQWFAFLLSLVAFSVGAYLVAIGQDGKGVAAIITTVASLAGVFIYARRQQAKERAEKRQTLTRRTQPG